MAQAAGMVVLSADEADGKHHENLYYYVGIDNARFKKPVIPGDQLEIEVSLERFLRGIGKFACVARVSGEVVAAATILLTIRPAGA
jgi:3-hydroxyacyl-[acyl-carrier-protein] dehydratase